MKLFLLVICACFTKVLSSVPAENVTFYATNDQIEDLGTSLNSVVGVNPKFVEDIVIASIEFRRSKFMFEATREIAEILTRRMKLHTFQGNTTYFREYLRNIFHNQVKGDYLKIYEDELSTKLTPEHTNHIKTFLRALYKTATNEEIEDASLYLYASNVDEDIERFRNELNAIVDVNPQFVEDMMNIFKAFQHDNNVISIVRGITYSFLVPMFNVDKSRIDATTFKQVIHDSGARKDLVNAVSDDYEKMLSPLPTELRNRFLKFCRVLHEEITLKEAEEALAYLYGPQKH